MNDPENGTRILESIVKVLLKPATANKVNDAVLELVSNLVTPLTTTTNDPNAAMENEETERLEQIGVEVVLNELDIILEHFQAWIAASNKDVKQLKKVGLKLDILRHLAPHISDPHQALTFLHQLLVMLGSVKRTESVTKVLVILQHLLDRLDNSHDLNDVLELVLPLFGRLASRPERIELSSLMSRIKAKDARLANLADICTNLCAYDRKRFEEPDFEARMDQFIRLRERVRSGSDGEPLTANEIKAVFYICCFSLR